ncbi:hypothetical protein HYV71_00320 [Candidatus Uhrbacteria bacterium]|nr:hypothetical protein [Candidatus Uhrbacteria bacterium]
MKQKKAHGEGLFQELEQRVFRPLFDVDFQAEIQDIAQGDNQISFTKTELNEHDREQLARYIASRSRDRGKEGDFSDESSWYAVDRLVYNIGETNLDIFSYLPDGYKILFCPNSKVYNGAVDYENRIICVTSDISSLGSIATILHEVGHVKDNERLKKLDVTELTKGGDWEENRAAEQMRKEREASLYALRKMWKELRKNEQTKKDILLYLKNMAYYSHCITGLQNISTARAMAHHNPYDPELDMQEELERQRYDAWEKFKQSDEYAAWKSMKEFTQLDEFEEYGAWCQWVEETGKVDDPEFLGKYFGFEQ